MKLPGLKYLGCFQLGFNSLAAANTSYGLRKTEGKKKDEMKRERIRNVVAQKSRYDSFYVDKNNIKHINFSSRLR